MEAGNVKKTDYSALNDGLVIHGKTDDELSSYVQTKLKQSSVFAEAFSNLLSFKSVFEVSCGLGTNLISFKNRGCEVNGSEYQIMLQYVLQGVKDSVVEMDITKPTAFVKKYDLVLCSEVLEHIEDDFIDSALLNLKTLSNEYIAITVPLIHPGYESCANHITWDNKNGSKWSRKLTQKELWKNSDGTVSQGHVTMATEKWWEDRFEKQGLYRDKNKELLIIQEFERGGIAVFYNIFVLTFRKQNFVQAVTDHMRQFARERQCQIKGLFDKCKLTGKWLMAALKQKISTYSSVSGSMVKKQSAQAGQYACSLALSQVESKRMTFRAGDLFFVTVSIHNKSDRAFITDPSCKNRIRIGVRFRGASYSVENLPQYLDPKGLGPNEETYVSFQIKCPYNCGTYNCEISLVEEGIAWFCDAETYSGNVLLFQISVC